ncbi:MAG: DNA alkylation repair protein [Bacteroidales bacterium]|nr:DNA alkylation repair protein [Bacteroidales bacterium]MDD4655923.1 DNA alkylation repair protein [Bacteroidales bacterium]
MNTLINNKLNGLAESDYKAFNRKLIPTNYEILGVRMPALRKLAKEIVANLDVSEYLNNAEQTTYEHIMLYGLVLGYLNEPLLETLFHYLDPLILKFDNWAHVDAIISSLKIFKKHPNEVLAHFLPLKTHPGEFAKRTFVILLMNYFLDSVNICSTLKHLSQIEQEQYYVDMAIAWATCEALVKHYHQTIPLLQQQTFTKFVHNKAIQKARESYRITPQTKEYLKTLSL